MSLKMYKGIDQTDGLMSLFVVDEEKKVFGVIQYTKTATWLTPEGFGDPAMFPFWMPMGVYKHVDEDLEKAELIWEWRDYDSGRLQGTCD